MKIVNPKVQAELDAGRPIRVNLGCGPRPRESYFGLDHLELPGVDIVADLNQPLSAFPDNSVEAIYTHHVFEHITNFLPLMQEIHRVVIPNGRIEVIVPHFSNPYGYSDPTHVRFFGLYTFYYLCPPEHQPRRRVPSFYIPQRFTVESVNVTLVPTLLMCKPIRRLTTKILNSSMRLLDWHERVGCRHFPVDSMRYVLRVQK